MRDTERGKRLIALFLLGVVLLNFPMLAVVDAGGQVLGLPPLFVYLFGAWAGLILVLALIVERRSAPRLPGESDDAR
jgi:membrane protein implicated in regulation of membrane protease activity